MRGSRPATGLPAAVASAFTATSSARVDALRTVAIARKRSPSRTSGGSPASSIRSCVERIVASPVPKRPAPEDATATMRKPVSESFSGISTVALPSRSSGTLARHRSSVSNSSRDGERPPPPPGAAALRPKWRLPITCICAVAVSTSTPRRDIIASSSFHDALGSSSSSPSSTAASATSLPAGGALPSASRTAIATGTRSRVRNVSFGGTTRTASSCAAKPTEISASPIRNAGLPRSTIAVGAGSPMRPRTRSADTNTFGAWFPRTGTSSTGSARSTRVTNASSTPSRSSVTRAVASRNGVRTWNRARAPGS